DLGRWWSYAPATGRPLDRPSFHPRAPASPGCVSPGQRTARGHDQPCSQDSCTWHFCVMRKLLRYAHERVILEKSITAPRDQALGGRDACEHQTGEPALPANPEVAVLLRLAAARRGHVQRGQPHVSPPPLRRSDRRVQGAAERGGALGRPGGTAG